MSDIDSAAVLVADGDSDDGFDLVDEPIQPLCISINQYGSRLAIGHEEGFTIYSVRQKGPTRSASTREMHPPSSTTGDAGEGGGRNEGGSSSTTRTTELKEETVFRPGTPMAGVGVIALLLETHFVAVVGGGPRPLDAAHKLVIMSGTHPIAKTTFTDTIKRVELISNNALVLTQTKFFISNFKGEKLLELSANGGIETITTRPPFEVSLLNGICVFPGRAQGHIQIVNIEETAAGLDIAAHSNSLAALALSSDGSVVASASERGTLVRVWKTADGTAVSEVRNSSTPTVLRHLRISHGDHIMCLTGTSLKIFYIGPDDDQKQYVVNLHKKEIAKNKSSYFSSLAFLSKFFDSRWACCEMEIPGHARPKHRSTTGGNGSSPGGTSTGPSDSTGLTGATSTTGSFLETALSFTKLTAPLVEEHRVTAADWDRVECWWENVLTRENTNNSTGADGKDGGSGSGSGNGDPGSRDRYRLFFATVEGILLSFDFDAVLGAVSLREEVHATE